MKNIDLVEVSSPGCSHCKAFEEYWHTIEKEWPNVSYKNVSVTTPEGQELAQKFMIFASPGIILNGELFATGGYDEQTFITKLKALSHQ